MSSLKNGNPINKDTQFGGKRGNRRGTKEEIAIKRKEHKAISEELLDLLDPNYSINDYKKIYKLAEKDSGLRGLFALAIINKDYNVIFKMMDRALGTPKQTIEQTNLTPPEPLEDLRKSK